MAYGVMAEGVIAYVVMAVPLTQTRVRALACSPNPPDPRPPRLKSRMLDRIPILTTFRSMPTADAEDPCWSPRHRKMRLAKTFQRLPSDPT